MCACVGERGMCVVIWLKCQCQILHFLGGVSETEPEPLPSTLIIDGYVQTQSGICTLVRSVIPSFPQNQASFVAVRGARIHVGISLLN